MIIIRLKKTKKQAWFALLWEEASLVEGIVLLIGPASSLAKA